MALRQRERPPVLHCMEEAWTAITIVIHHHEGWTSNQEGSETYSTLANRAHKVIDTIVFLYRWVNLCIILISSCYDIDTVWHKLDAILTCSLDVITESKEHSRKALWTICQLLTIHTMKSQQGIYTQMQHCNCLSLLFRQFIRPNKDQLDPWNPRRRGSYCSYKYSFRISDDKMAAAECRRAMPRRRQTKQPRWSDTKPLVAPSKSVSISL